MADWFAMSSRFYKDLDDMGVSESAQMALARILGYIAEQEQMDGYIAQTALKKLGMRAVSRRVDELIQNQIVTPSENGLGYYVRAFEKWQGPLIAHVKKKNADRQRIAEKRRKAEMSRDTPATVATHRTEQNRTTTHLDDDNSRNVDASDRSSSSTAFADGTPIPEPPAEIETAAHATPPVPSSAARTVVRQELGANGYPRRTLDRLAVQVGKLGAEGIADDVIRESLREWERRTGARPEWLAAIAGDVVQARRARAAPHVPASTTDARIAAAQALKTNVHPLRGLES